jgi:hypothetical protein
MNDTTSKKLFHYIRKLPIELVYIIESYVPTEVTLFLNKKNYINNHKHLMQNSIDKKQIENYIRFIVRQDNDLAFKLILDENIHKWFKITKYLYKDAIFMNYVYFLISYCEDNESTKCKNLILNKLDELGLSKNQHKKSLVKYITS